MGSIVTGIKTSAWVLLGLSWCSGRCSWRLPSGRSHRRRHGGSPPNRGPPSPRIRAAAGRCPRRSAAERRRLETPTDTVLETPREVRIELPGDVLFDFDQWDIRPDAEPTLRQVAEIIQRYPRAKVAIAGYTDAKGADAYNLQLSARRAKSVKAWLVQQGGVEGKRMTTKGWGEAKPVAPNTHPDGSDNPEGRQQNRRVELTVKK